MDGVSMGDRSTSSGHRSIPFRATSAAFTCHHLAARVVLDASETQQPCVLGRRPEWP
jgi:hypothetical protein